MSHWKAASFLALVILISALAVGCGGGARGAVYVRTAPPPPIGETMTVAPGPGYIWIPGHHVWRSDAYVWEGGRWELRPAGRREWVPGYWKETRRGWVWVEGHWR